jgi:ankyrin repeat protein
MPAGGQTRVTHIANTETRKESIARLGIFFAVLVRDPEGVELALKQGWDINSRDAAGRTPLMIAASQQDPRMVQLLIRHGADPTLQDKEGRNAYQLAMRAQLSFHIPFTRFGADLHLPRFFQTEAARLLSGAGRR